jgi:hypothetical protein
MNIQTKFGLGDSVYRICKDHVTKYVPCNYCDGTGKVTVVGKPERTCPDCTGRKGKDEWFGQEWQVLNGIDKIGNVRVSLYFDSEGGIDEYQYMLFETGVGSGTLWKADQLYATEEEAQAECDKRNSQDAIEKDILNKLKKVKK